MTNIELQEKLLSDDTNRIVKINNLFVADKLQLSNNTIIIKSLRKPEHSALLCLELLLKLRKYPEDLQVKIESQDIKNIEIEYYR